MSENADGTISGPSMLIIYSCVKYRLVSYMHKTGSVGSESVEPHVTKLAESRAEITCASSFLCVICPLTSTSLSLCDDVDCPNIDAMEAAFFGIMEVASCLALSGSSCLIRTV